MPTLPALPTLGEVARENRWSWGPQPLEDDRFFRQLREESRWREEENAKQRRHEEMLKEMRQQHIAEHAQRESEYRARFGARDTNCLYGRGPVGECP